jgi:protein-L-isoaspartate(D-aspartate) O-methyltransferase
VIVDLESRALVLRHKLVGVLRARGVTDPNILAAFAKVPRHLFVDQFWVGGFDGPADAGAAKMRVMDDSVSDEDLAWVYAPDTALLAAPFAEATTSVSAPYLIAGMLRELDLAAGLRVLEIGAGSGYHAALMAALVGPSGSVVTVDIDADLAERTRSRLNRLGYRTVRVAAADGTEGVPGNIFDRIVATVGCVDVAAAWRDQLRDHGVLMVPLLHGGAHPRVRLRKTAGGLAGEVVGYSGFVAIQGAQAGQSPWRLSPTPAGQPVQADLPGPIADALRPPDPTLPGWNPNEWAFGFYVSLRDQRAGFGAGLYGDESYARVVGGRLLILGDDGECLAGELISMAQDWLDLGTPGLDCYRTTFEPAQRPTCELVNTADPAGPWMIGRPDHVQTVSLQPTQ